MKLFSEKVNATLSSSGLNILQVKNFEEIFYDVFSLEINGRQFTVEKVQDYQGNPVVNIPVIFEGKKILAPFVLKQGNIQEIIFNKTQEYDFEVVEEKVEEISIPIIDSIEEEPEIPLGSDTLTEVKRQIRKAKASAQQEIIESAKKQKHLQEKEINKKIGEVEEILDKTRQQLIADYLETAKQIEDKSLLLISERESKLEKQRNQELRDLQISIRDKIQQEFKKVHDTLTKAKNNLGNNIQFKITEKFDEEVKKLEKQFLNLIEKTTQEKIDNVQKDIIKLIPEDKQDFYVDQLVELKNEFTQGINRALSRIGNIKSKTQSELSELKESITQLTADILTSATLKIEQYYNDNIVVVETKIDKENSALKKELQTLIEQSKQSILNEVTKINPVDVYTEALKVPKDAVNADQIKKDLQKDIELRFSNELRNLKRLVELSSSGGSGSVAVQFANGGTMYGDLTVVGKLSANEYLGIIFPPSDYLPLSGGTVNGNVTITGTLSVTNLEALSANITVLDIKQYELSGFNITGNTTVNGTLSATNVYGNNIVYTTENQTISGTKTFVNTLSAKENVVIDGNATLGGNLSATGTGYFGGKVGIGVNDPDSSLEVKDTFKVAAGSNNMPVTISQLSPAANLVASAGAMYIRSGPSANMVFQTNNGTEYMRIQYTGQVGIGTSTPNEKLTVSGNISATGCVYSSCASISSLNVGTITNVTVLSSFTLPLYTTTQRDALIASAGNVIYNTTTGRINNYTGTAWNTTVIGEGITKIVSLTQAEYDLLTPETTTFYVITDAPSILQTTISTKTVDYTITSNDSTIIANGAGITITLPSANGLNGRIFVIKNRNAASCTLSAYGAETIDDENTITLISKESATIQSDNSNWWII